MRQVINGLDSVRIYVDNIIVHDSARTQHLEGVEAFLA